MKKSTIGILGIGEVGKAIAELYEKKFELLKKDKKLDDIKKNELEVLHVCIPYSDKFEKNVIEQSKRNRPSLVIIHSTIKPGTTSKIYNSLQIPIVHSPIMGTHDRLASYILKFKKFIGPVNKKSANLAKKHLEVVGIQTIVLDKPIDSELGKLLDTAYYAWNIIFGKIVRQISKELNTNYESVYGEFNKIYNDGYKNTKKNVLRPVLKYIEGPIGGHCIMENTEILNEYFSNPITKLILDQNKLYKRKGNKT